MAGVKRLALDRKGRERITVDAYLSPFDEKKFGWLARCLGPVASEQIVAGPEDLISAQAALTAGVLDYAIPPHQLFLGVRDLPELGQLRPAGLLKTLQLLQTAPWYLAAWPDPGFLAPLLAAVPTGTDESGAAQLPLGFWQRQVGSFFLLSSDPQLLARAATQLQTAKTDNAAHVRVHVKDLSQTRLARLISAFAYGRARRTSAGNARLLQAISQQLQVPPEQAFATATELLDAELVCPLGGRYELVERPGETRCWQSTKWPTETADRLPEQYRAALLDWFRGLDFDLTREPNRLVAHARLDMQRKEGSSPFQLPAFPLMKLFGGDQTATPSKDAQSPPTPPAEPPR